MIEPTEGDLIQFVLSAVIVHVLYRSVDDAAYFSQWFRKAAVDSSSRGIGGGGGYSLGMRTAFSHWYIIISRPLAYWLQVVAFWLFLRFGESDGAMSFADRIAYRAVVVTVLVNLWLCYQYNQAMASRRSNAMLRYKGTAMTVLSVWIMVTAIAVSVMMFIHIGTRADGNNGTYYAAPAILYTLYTLLTVRDFYQVLDLKDHINDAYMEHRKLWAEKSQ